MKESLLTKIENAPRLDFGDIFNKSIELFKKVWVQGLLTMLITIGLFIPFGLVVYLPFVFLGIFNPEMFEAGYEPDLIMLIPFYLMLFAMVLFLMPITIALQAAFFRICKNKDLGIEGNDEYFYFMKKEYLGKLFVLGLASLGISILATMLCFFPVIYVSVPMSFFTLVFAFNPELSVGDIIKVSFKLGHKKWWLTFGLAIVCGILAEIVGLLLCGIGILITASFTLLPKYFIYKESLDDDTSMSESQI